MTQAGATKLVSSEPVEQFGQEHAVPERQQQWGKDRGQRPHERRAAQRARPDAEPVDAAQEQRDLRRSAQEEADGNEQQQGQGREHREAAEVSLCPWHPQRLPQDLLFRKRGF